MTLQAGIPRHPDHVAHSMAFAPANQPLPAEPRIAANDDPYRRPRLAQPGHDQLDHGGRMLGTVDPAAAQDAGEHGLASEHIQRQVAVVVVVGVELGLFLFPVQGDVRGVDVQYQLIRTTRLGWQ
jgi:hypothetical protein